MQVLITTKDLCEWFKIAPNTANTWRRDGMPFIRINSRVVRYDKAEIEKWARENGKIK